jgi:hypothetical protein
MPPPSSGSFASVALADGTRAFHLRFRAAGRRRRVVLHERAECECGCGGGWSERAARNELGNLLARVRAGVWEPAQKPRIATTESPTFHEYASAWLQAKVDGVLGDRPIDANTEADYRWRLTRHVLPYFAGHRLDAIQSTATCASRSRRTSCEKPPSFERPSRPEPSCATAAAAGSCRSARPRSAS